MTECIFPVLHNEIKEQEDRSSRFRVT